MPKPGVPNDPRVTICTAWGENPPPEVVALAEACVSRGSQASAATAIGYSGSAVSGVLSRKYKGNYEDVFAKVRATFMRASVDCPALSKSISGAQCSAFQQIEMPQGATETKIYRRCRSGCEHSQLAAYRHVKGAGHAG